MLFRRLPVVKRCCCWVPLKYGVVFIGLFYIVMNIMLKIENHVVVCYMGMVSNKCRHQHLLVGISYVQLFTMLMYLVPSAMLIVGVFLKSVCLVSVFLYGLTVGIAIDGLCDVIVLVFGLAEPRCGIDDQSLLICIVAGTLFVCISVYFIIVVNSYRSRISRRRKPTAAGAAKRPRQSGSDTD